MSDSKRSVEQAEALNKGMESALSLGQHDTKKEQEGKIEFRLKLAYDMSVNLVGATTGLNHLLEHKATLQKLLDWDEDNYIKELLTKIQIMEEATYALKRLISHVTKAIKEKNNDIEASLNEAKEKYKSLEVLLIEQRKVYEDVIAVLLKHVEEPSSDAICVHKDVLEFQTQTITSQEEKIDQLTKAHEELLREIEQLKEQCKSTPVIKIEDPEGAQIPEKIDKPPKEFLTPPVAMKRERLQVVIESPNVNEDDERKDPDRQKTPLGQRVMERQGVKRSSTGGCSCKANCTKKCGCWKAEKTCTTACRCKCDGKEEVEKTDQSSAERSTTAVKNEKHDENAPPEKIKKSRRLFQFDL